jgi:predicted nucleic acid-binding Zn ribbon protein
MASKTAKSRTASKPKMDTHQRRMKWLQTAFIVISALLVLSMVLAAVINR